jgi:hypothetical protein
MPFSVIAFNVMTAVIIGIIKVGLVATFPKVGAGVVTRMAAPKSTRAAVVRIKLL